MPSASDFKKAFNLKPGVALHSSQGKKGVLGTVQNSTIGHTAKQRNELYEFPSTIDVGIKDITTTSRSLEAAMKHFLSDEEKLVYSAYGSPYSCSIKNVKINSFDPENAHASITFLGKAIRRRDMPTIGKKKEEERKKEAAEATQRKRKVTMKDIEVSKKDEKQWLLPQMRVIKSRFGTSKCTICGDIIDPGTKIAKDAHSQERGGWMHASCAVKHVKNTKQKKKKSTPAAISKKKARPSSLRARKKRHPLS